VSLKIKQVLQDGIAVNNLIFINIMIHCIVLHIFLMIIFF